MPARMVGVAAVRSMTAALALAAVVVLMLGAAGFGAFSLGTRFRIYSLATLATIVALGVAAGVYGSRLAARQPTPGFGIVERALIYAFLVWAAVLGVALVRRRGARAARAVE